MNSAALRVLPWLSCLVLSTGGCFSDAGPGGSGETGEASESGGDGDEGETGEAEAESGDEAGDGDEGGEVELDCEYPEELDIEIAQALDQEDPFAIEDADRLLDAISVVMEAQRRTFDADLAALWGLDEAGEPLDDGTHVSGLTWYPSHDSARLRGTFGRNAAALISNATWDGDEPEERSLSILGRHAGTPYLVMGGNPFRGDPAMPDPATANAAMQQLMRNAIAWLTGAAAGEGPPQVVLAQTDESAFFPDETDARAWLAHQYGDALTLNEIDACDGEALAGCLAGGVDLLIISQFQAEDDETQPALIVDAVREALEAGTPVLYVHHNGDLRPLGEALLELFEVHYDGDNYWSQFMVEAGEGAGLLGRLSPEYTAIRTATTKLREREFSFEVTDIAGAPDDSAAYRSEFADGAEATRDLLGALDEAGTGIFEDCGNEVPKLLAFAGDQLRQEISYPMTTAGTATDVFLRAYFADHSVYNRRNAAPAQPERGSFDDKDLSAVVGEDFERSFVSGQGFRATGAYALPGEPLTITRSDDTAVETWVFINPHRSGSTHEWEDDTYGGFGRPKYLRSESVPLGPGESVTLVNPYGGPVQLDFEGETGETVTIAFEGVGRHAYWAGPEDDAAFVTSVEAATFNWVELVTPQLEMHNRLDKWLESASDPRWPTAAALAGAVERHMWNDAHVHAGFRGPLIDVVPEIHDWAEARGLEVPFFETIKHGVMDQPSCGAGCSGNPYDAGWAFGPLDHGDLHELGHSLQNGRFQLRHGEQRYGNHAATNWTPFYVNDLYFQSEGTGGDWGIPHQHIFEELQAAFLSGDAVGAFSTHMESYFEAKIADGEIRDCYAFFLQAMAAARHAGTLTNGYNFVPRAHILDEAVDDALADEETWLAERDALGFSLFSFAEADAMGSNDFIVVALALGTELDYRDFMAMWGLPVSQTASDQVAALALPVVERAFFAFEEDDHTHGGLSTENGSFARLMVDGVTVWPG